MSYGITLNCSLVQPSKDDGYQMGVSIKNSDGIDIDYSIEGDDPTTMIDEAIKDIVDDYLTQWEELEQARKTKEEEEKKNQVEEKEDDYIKQLQEIIEDLKAENNSLKTDLNILQRRADDAVNKQMNKKSNAPFRFDDSLIDFFDKFFD